jgi:hypothetical protein
MTKEATCTETNCSESAIGYIPMEEEHPLCAKHFDEAAINGYFVCLNNERICPACKGRAGHSTKVNCAKCGNVGLIEREQEQKRCSYCKGLGYTSGKRGRRWPAKAA